MSGIFVVCSYNYEKEDEDELTITEGEKLELVDEVDENGWVTGKNANGESGLIPMDFRLIEAGEKAAVPKTAAAQPQDDALQKDEIAKESILKKTEDVDFDMTLPEVKIPLESSDSRSDSDDSDGQKDFEAQILGEKIEKNEPKEQKEAENAKQEEPDLNELPKKEENRRESSSSSSSDDSSVDFDPEKELQKSLTDQVENNEQKSDIEDEAPPPPKPRRLSLAPSPIQLRAQKTLSVDSQGSILTQDSQSKEEFALDENSSDETEIKEENLDKTPKVQKSENPAKSAENNEETQKPATKKEPPKNAGMTFREVRKHYAVVNSKIKNELKLQKGDRVQIVNFSEEQEVNEIRIPRTDETGNFPKKYLNFEEKIIRYDAGSFYAVAFSYEPNTDKLLPLKRDEEIQILQIPENGKYVVGKNKTGKEGQLLLDDLCDDLLKAGRIPEGAKEPKKIEPAKAANPPKSEKPKKRRCVLL